MSSQFAMRLTEVGLSAGNGLIQDALDKELEEVRKVLNGLVRHQLSTGACWCPSRVSQYGDWFTPGEHDENCNRARVLTERLSL